MPLSPAAARTWEGRAELDVGVLIAAYLLTHPAPASSTLAMELASIAEDLQVEGRRKLGGGMPIPLRVAEKLDGDNHEEGVHQMWEARAQQDIGVFIARYLRQNPAPSGSHMAARLRGVAGDFHTAGGLHLDRIDRLPLRVVRGGGA
jgi:hypothetical protein